MHLLEYHTSHFMLAMEGGLFIQFHDRTQVCPALRIIKFVGTLLSMAVDLLDMWPLPLHHSIHILRGCVPKTAALTCPLCADAHAAGGRRGSDAEW